eukprot:2235187-Pyramimonas_sp.AAC.1
MAHLRRRGNPVSISQLPSGSAPLSTKKRSSSVDVKGNSVDVSASLSSVSSVSCPYSDWSLPRVYPVVPPPIGPRP